MSNKETAIRITAAMASAMGVSPEECYQLAKESALKEGATPERAEELGRIASAMDKAIREDQGPDNYKQFEDFNSIISSIEEDIEYIEGANPLPKKVARAKSAMTKMFSIKPPRFTNEFIQVVKPEMITVIRQLNGCLANVNKSTESKSKEPNND
jgi:hypothetical protein